MSISRARLRAHAVVLAAYLAATLAFTWPLAAHLSDAVVAGIDPWQAVWNFWSVAGRLAAGHSPFHTDLLYYPQGADLYLHTLFPAVSVPLAPLTWVAGPLVAYNVAQLLAFVLTGYTMYLLCRDLGASRLGAFLAGFGLDFSAWHTVRLHGHLNLAAIYWMPLYLLCLFRLARPAAGRARVVWPLLAGITLALSALSEYQQLVYLGLITLLWLLNHLLARRADRIPRLPSRSGQRALEQPAAGREEDSPPRYGEGLGERLTESGVRVTRLALLGRVAAAWAVGLALLAPVLAGILREQATGEYARPDLAQVVTFSADLLAYVVPFQYNTWAGTAVTPVVQTLWGKLDTERALYLPATLLLLGLWGLAREWPRSRVWLNVAAVSILLSLGPALHAGGKTSIPLPYLLLYLLPGADQVRVPARFGLLAILALTVLAAFGITRIGALIAAQAPGPRAAARRLACAGGLIFLALAAEELAVPQPLIAADVPAFYRGIAAPPGTGPALLEVPIRDEAVYEYYQTVHGHPLVGGYLSRDRADPLIEGGPLIRDLKYLDAGDIVRQDPVVAGQVLLARAQIGYILVHKDPPLTVDGYLPWTAAQQGQARALAAAAGHPVYDDAHLTAYAMRPPPPDHPPAVALGAGWQPVLTAAQRGRGRWATAGAVLDVDASHPVTVVLQITMSSYPTQRPVLLLGLDRVLAQWTVPTGAPGPFTGPPVALPAGVTRLTLASTEPAGLLPPATLLDRYRAPAMLFATDLRLLPVPLTPNPQPLTPNPQPLVLAQTLLFWLLGAIRCVQGPRLAAP